MRPGKRDNSTYRLKAMLRTTMRSRMEAAPVICETHGGHGLLFQTCYADVTRGVVFEKDLPRAHELALQRPTWAVYAADCVKAMEQGAGAHLEVNVLDVDPFGDPWPAIRAFFESDRPRAPVVWVAVNDGLKSAVLKSARGWSHSTTADMAIRFGNDALFGHYLEICQILMEETVAQAGYTLRNFAGYYCGSGHCMTHYLARLELTDQASQ